MTIKELEGKKTLILGFGQEGIETFLFLKKEFPGQRVGVADKKDFRKLSRDAKNLLKKHTDTRLHLGSDYLESIGEYDVIIKTPGIPLSLVAPRVKKNQRITSQTEIFFANCKAVIIGVTGTKGKSTTCSLLRAALKEGGKSAYLAGNIGNPGLHLLPSLKPEDIVVYELSSFQLMNMRQSPHIAILLNVYPEHFDHHANFREYAGAKAKITAHQTAEDILIYNANDAVSVKIAAKSRAKKLPFVPGSSRIIPKEKKQWIAPLEPVLLTARALKIPTTAVKRALLNFQPLCHRMERAGKWKGITFVNDSAATNPGAAIAALEHYKDSVGTLVAGGSEKGTSFKEFAVAILRHGIPALVLFLTTGTAIWREIQHAAKKLPRASLPLVFFARNMKEAVRLCYRHTKPGSVCLLSPACASFTVFRDYKDRGEQFKKFAMLYGQKKQRGR